MKFLPNDVLKYIGSGNRIRILWLHPNADFAYVINIDEKKAYPVVMNISTLTQDTEPSQDGQPPVAQLIDDPFFIPISEDDISESNKTKRDKSLSLISQLICNVPDIFVKEKRWKLLADQGIDAGHTDIYKKMRWYWQGGQRPNALLPRYGNCGAKGQERTAKTGKLGRPTKPGVTRLTVTPAVRKIFQVAVDRWYASGKKFNLQKAYDKMIEEFFCEKLYDQVTKSVKRPYKESTLTEGLPTPAQFKYWLRKDNNELAIKRKRVSPRNYDKDMRGLLGTSNSEVWGPGARFQIDATILDVYLVSRFDRTKIIGRPVLYVVIDVYSRMIVGMYVGIEGPSWVTAMMALTNCVEDKVAYCAKYGIVIDKEDWPCHHLPAKLLGDRGEIAGKTIDNLVNQYQVEVENTASYRADWKGIVEQRFRILPANFKPFVDGYIETDFQIRGGHDYRLDAVLDLDQITAILIQCVLYNNNWHDLKNYDKDYDLAKANIPNVPLELWNWGINNKSGRLRTFPVQDVKYCLMVDGTASVTEFGIKFKGNYYTCPTAMQEQWFDTARQNGRRKMGVKYDPRDMDEIFFRNADGQIESCQKLERSRAYVGFSDWEIGQALQIAGQTEHDHQPGKKTALYELNGNIELIVDTARQMKPDVQHLSKVERTKNIQVNRGVEKAAVRAEEAFKFGDSANAKNKPIPSNVVPFAQPEDDFSEPSIMDILDMDGDSNV